MNTRAAIASLFMAMTLVTTSGCTATRTQKSAGEVVDDSVVLAKVKSSLLEDPVTSGLQIDVNVYRGVVQLNGTVDSSHEKATAAADASRVEGVLAVHNNLVVSPSETVGQVVDDSVLTAKVKAALADDPGTNAYQIDVETDKGVVGLSGFVNNSKAKAAATTVAMAVPGVRSVNNRIDIKSYP